jgi:hypothetical protein
MIDNDVIELNAVTPTLLTVGGHSANDPRTVIISDASALIYLGGSGVTSSNGSSFTTVDKLVLDLFCQDDLYAIASTGTPTVRVFRTRSN